MRRCFNQPFDVTGIEFNDSSRLPLLGKISTAAINPFAQISRFFFGMVDIHNLKRLGKDLRAIVPNPMCSVADQHLLRSVEESPFWRLALDRCANVDNSPALAGVWADSLAAECSRLRIDQHMTFVTTELNFPLFGG